MITGFNTDVRHDGRVYHVQTEDRGREKAVLESLVYVGGTIVAKKSTPYSDQLAKGATEDMIAGLLKKQHQVIIAAIKAGRIEELIRHSLKQERAKRQPQAAKSGQDPPAQVRPHAASGGNGAGHTTTPEVTQPPAKRSRTEPAPAPEASTPRKPTSSSGSLRRGTTAGLNLDQVISDYLNRSSGQARLDVKVLTPDVFIAGKNVGLRVQVTHDFKPEPDAIVTVKVIGTAFKPQVFIGRAGGDGMASFSLNLPSFSAGTAAIVIEAQSGRGRGELKNLIRRA
ncbi:MAG TPA: hypothetical protein VKM94_11935 [Blastocatellia bacterium]|nr:hypothetical protein [Blastocatellia bacterium]